MLTAATFLTLLSQFPYLLNSLRACVPNTQFILYDKICNCNHVGQWSESDCYNVERRQICRPGQITYEGCKQCVCQPNGQFSCTSQICTQAPGHDLVSQNFNTANTWCTPFRSYYVNCNICVCPASGRMSDAHCAKDPTCSLVGQPLISNLTKITCISKVMYLFPCLHCLCSDDGYFVASKCVETCQGRQKIENSRRCIPKTYYRKECNICKCPVNSIPDDQLCSKVICNNATSNVSYLGAVRSKSAKCQPHKFTKAICLYCDCSNKGTIDENSCVELECASDYRYDVHRESCSPGETVPICMECLCLRDGQTNIKFCSRTCSYDSKLVILNDIIGDSAKDTLIDRNLIKKPLTSDVCEAGSIYEDQHRYCLCPDNGYTNFHLCTASKDTSVNKKVVNPIAVNVNVTCEPNTFVEFGCNTCFCSKKGRIDIKWCTHDDCEAKRIIQEAHARNPKVEAPRVASGTCIPGSITKIECNFCICPENGYVEHLVCTKNDCSSLATPANNEKFTCEPLAYYEVDCNVCFCPRDGLKNVAKCTKNHCERSFLRSDVCVAGQLFSEECNVCVCPPNGNKSEKACTNYTCYDTAPWKKIFQLSESLLGNQVAEDATRNLELCFPGEEFAIGCKLCVCPDMGLRVYATCSQMLCDDEADKPDRGLVKRVNNVSMEPRRATDCTSYNVSSKQAAAEGVGRENCTPGSMYIIRCQQCICPYMGSIIPFCRPLPFDKYCEQAYPSVNFLPMGRRQSQEIPEPANSTETNDTAPQTVLKIRHVHTQYHCDKPGKVMDQCFKCECEATNLLIEEHCFKSQAENCSDVITPAFLTRLNKVELG